MFKIFGVVAVYKVVQCEVTENNYFGIGGRGRFGGGPGHGGIGLVC